MAINVAFLQNGQTNNASLLRNLTEFLGDYASGVKDAGSMLVTPTGTPNMQVHAAAGEALILGTTAPTTQGAYHVKSDAIVDLTISAADATHDRWDLIVCKVEDAETAGAVNAGSIVVVAGTASASPADPAVPANSVTLARVVVVATHTSINAGNITDLRPKAAGLGGFHVVPNLSLLPTHYPGAHGIDMATGIHYWYDGTGQRIMPGYQRRYDAVGGGAATLSDVLTVQLTIPAQSQAYRAQINSVVFCSWSATSTDGWQASLRYGGTGGAAVTTASTELDGSRDIGANNVNRTFRPVGTIEVADGSAANIGLHLKRLAGGATATVFADSLSHYINALVSFL